MVSNITNPFKSYKKVTMKKLRQRSEDFTKKFDRLTLKDMIQATDNRITIREVLEMRRLYNIKMPEDATFMQRMLVFPPITPKRYVWHVGKAFDYPRYPDESPCFSIATEGLKSSYGKNDRHVVFANNNAEHCSHFFPFVDFSYADPRDPSINYWRIDTYAFEAEWYVDPNLLYIVPCMSKNPTDYICTPSDIPAHALKLYHYPKELFEHTDPKRRQYCCIYDIRLLEPDKRVNWWISRKMQAA